MYSFKTAPDLECYDIGVIALDHGKEALGIEWLKESWERVHESERADNLYILKKLANATAEVGSGEHMSRDARKPVFRVSDQVKQKPACKVTEAG